MIRLHSLGTRITSRSVRRSCTARCEGLALLGAKVLHRSVRRSCTARCEGLALLGAKVLHHSGQGSRPARIRHTRSAEQRPFARACKDLLLEREGHLIPSERVILFRASEPASFERVNGGLRGIKSRRCRRFVENRNLYRTKISKMLKYTQK